MDRKQKVSLVVVSVACALLAVTVVTASSWMPSHTPLYSIRMEKASSQMNFLPTDVNTVTYTAENGYNLNYYVAGDEVTPLDYTNVSVTCADTCVTCVSTCSSTCVSTCSSTCASTCSYTCVNTCCTCVNTCENTCVSTCSSTCASTCSYTCVSTCYTCVGTCPNTCLDTCYPCV